MFFHTAPQRCAHACSPDVHIYLVCACNRILLCVDHKEKDCHGNCLHIVWSTKVLKQLLKLHITPSLAENRPKQHREWKQGNADGVENHGRVRYW
jgi:hypothetical protein